MIRRALTVVLVEDDDAWRAALGEWLERDGMRVLALSRGDWVTSALRTHRVDIVVLDVELPGQSGLDILGAVRRQWPGLPVIVMTAFGGRDMAATALRDGATAYLDKPFALARLVATIRQITAAPTSDPQTP